MPLPKSPTPGSDTIYLTVVDRDRTAVSLINSLYSAFGTGICTEKTGVMLHNRGTGFVVEPEHPNTIAPGKRPMHTIIPALAMRNGRCEMPFGVMGADYQPMGHAHVVTNMVDYGMDVQQAIDAPRMFYVGETTEVERGVPAATIAGLKARGHNVLLRPCPHGGGQAIVIDWERGRADRRLRPAQGRLRDRVLSRDLDRERFKSLRASAERRDRRAEFGSPVRADR